MAEVVPCTREHILNLTPRLRESDREELYEASGNPPESVLMASFECSEEAWAAVEDGFVLCVFGLAPHPQLHEWGVPWMLASEQFYDHTREFTKECREWIDRMHNRYPKLLNMVHIKNVKAVRWLKWCGFTLHPPIQAGPNRTTFIPFTKEKSNV